jgi:hypothetical protein
MHGSKNKKKAPPYFFKIGSVGCLNVRGEQEELDVEVNKFHFFK